MNSEKSDDSDSVETFLASRNAASGGPNTKRPNALMLLTIGIVIAGLGYGGTKMYGAIRERQAAVERKKQDEIAARETERAIELARIADQKREQIKNADSETLKGLINSCQDQINAVFSKSVFGINFPHYSPDDLQKFADVGAAFKMPLGGWPSAVLDNYDFDIVAWNLARITDKDYPITSVSFVVEGSQDGFSVRHYAAVFTCDLDGLRAEEPDRTEIHYLD
ncbi:hypothetical protein [Rhizobium phaseoli]|uniref:Pilus assembly protein n=1 Tax=Rhizobium phaseoli TaxID=396 RepID=A0ABN4QNC4_9HYPH|nr:hypothetical protein [Rhizobium phaseoli]ANL87066.1 hypothetical protein AMC81_PA00043 [Rhizobium phaseoli]ANL93575.1 hypothetical protein AMC80_PA00043 [Rhizobium phaseoli]